MTPKPRLAIKDLKLYLRPHRFKLSKRAEEVFLEAEEISERHNTTLKFECLLLALVKSSRRFQSSLLASGSDLSLIESLLDEFIKDDIFNAYGHDGLAPYSKSKDLKFRKQFINSCLDNGRKYSRREILEADLLEALIELPEKLKTPLLQPTRRIGDEPPEDKRYIGPRRQINQALSLTGTVPPHIRDSVFLFRKDNPYYEKNCFLVMSFASSPLHKSIYKVLEAILSDNKLKLLRADKKEYAKGVLNNIETYIYGCSFAIAAFERIQKDQHNPNVAFEVGYLEGLGKPVCFLKEKTVSNLFTDLIGRLWCEFDIQEVETTLRPAVEDWLRDHRII